MITVNRGSSLRYSAERRKQSRASSRIVKVAVRDLLRPYGYLVIALSVVLKIRRTLTGKEVNRLLADTHARYKLAAERAASEVAGRDRERRLLARVSAPDGPYRCAENGSEPTGANRELFGIAARTFAAERPRAGRFRRYHLRRM
jgi:hypothetical protein